MAAGDRDRVDRLLAQLVGDLAKLALVEAAKIFRGNDLDRAGAFWNRTRASPRNTPAFKGPERRKIYRALHHKEAKAQIRLNRDGRAIISAKPLIRHRGGTRPDAGAFPSSHCANRVEFAPWHRARPGRDTSSCRSSRAGSRCTPQRARRAVFACTSSTAKPATASATRRSIPRPATWSRPRTRSKATSSKNGKYVLLEEEELDEVALEFDAHARDRDIRSARRGRRDLSRRVLLHRAGRRGRLRGVRGHPRGDEEDRAWSGSGAW